MEREDWRRDDADRRLREREDYGQADYSNLYGYDPSTRSGYKAYDDGRPADDRPVDQDYRRLAERQQREERHFGDPRRAEPGRGHRDERLQYERDHRRARRD